MGLDPEMVNLHGKAEVKNSHEDKKPRGQAYTFPGSLLLLLINIIGIDSLSESSWAYILAIVIPS